MTTLKQAINDGKLDEFVEQRRDDPQGDKESFNRTLDSMAGKSKPVPKTSSVDVPDD